MRSGLAYLTLLFLLYSAPAASQNLFSPTPSFVDSLDARRYTLPQRLMPLEKALIKLREAGAEFSYRPDQLPNLAVSVPGGRRPLGAWLSFLLRGTEITFEAGAGGYIIYPDPDLPKRQVNLYGVVSDGESGERLLGAAIYSTDEEAGTTTNEYGFYSLPLNGGRRRIRVSYIGYRPAEIELVLLRDSLLDVRLVPDRELPAVIVRATPTLDADMFLTDTRTSIGQEEVDRIGGPGGEADPLRVARLLPGVETGADGLGGIFIRGSESGHNLVLLDGVPVYNLNHAAGLFSIFSNDAVRRVDLYKDGLPARFGGRIGGVLDVHTRDGNLYEASTSLGSSMLAAHFASEGPVQVGSSSYLVTGRYFWTRGLLARASERYKENRGRQGKLDYQVYDVNFKLNQQIGEKGRLYLSAYRGLDNYENTAEASDTVTVLNPAGSLFRYATPMTRYEDVRWGNSVVALRYNHVFNRRLFGNFRLSYSDLLVDAAYERSDSLVETTNNVLTGDVFSGRYASDIQQIGVAFDGQYTLQGGSEIRFGLEANRHRFTPQLKSGETPLSAHLELEELGDSHTMRPREVSAYASLTGSFAGLNYRIGLRGQFWRNRATFLTLSPRLLVAGRLGPAGSWRFTADRAVQSVHLVNSFVIGLPTDMWVPATEGLAPATATQAAFTFNQRFARKYGAEVSVYYRDLQGLVAFTENSNQTSWVDNLSRGKGYARGAEFTISRNSERFKGWASYILAQSRREFDGSINRGRPFNFRYGRTHGVKLVALYLPSPKWSLSATWRYGSGANYSLSAENLLFVNPATVTAENELESLNLVTERNGVRLPANHRLDVNAQFTFGGEERRRFVHTLDIGVYNVYNRHNPIYYDVQTSYFARDEQLIANRDFVQVYLAPVTPTLSYRVRFRH